MILPSRKGPRVVVTRGKESIQLPERLDTDNMLFFGATGPSVYPIQRVVLHQWSLMIYQVLLRDHCLQVQVMPLLLLNSLDGLIQYVVFWELLHVHTVCAHCVHAFALQDCHLSQLLLSTTAVSVLQHHFFLHAAGSGATSSGDNDILCYLCSTDVTCTCKTVYTPTTACEL